MSVTAAIAGGAAALLGNVISGIVGSKNQNDNIDKQIAAQKEENAKTREHNLQLAQLQNTMNIKQWERENQYNSPAAQMQRFQAAGLNPNLIYGQSNTSGQISGSLTSGAPATPTDMSALSGKRSGLASAFKSVGDLAMQIPMYREQVRSLKLDNEAKEIANWNARVDKGIREALKTIAVDPKSLEDLLTSSDFQLGSEYEIRRKLLDIQDMNYRNRQNAWNNMLRNETFEGELQSLASKYEVEYGKAQEFMTNLELLTDANASEYRRKSAVRELSDFFKDDLTFKEFFQGAMQLMLEYLPKFIPSR